MLRKPLFFAALLFSSPLLIAQPLMVERLIGSTGGGGYVDGRFSAPRAIATDAAGNIYVADTGNHAIRRIRPDGTVTTLAGLPGAPGGFADGVGTLARFNFPAGIAVDRVSGAIYVSDKDNHVIRRITPDGVVTTVAGQPGVAGTADAQGTAAKFAFPRGLVVDATGTIYVADAGNHAIRRINPDGVVNTVAGRPRFAGGADGTVAEATFDQPSDIAIDPTTGNFYVADAGGSIIRRITPAGVVTTVAGRYVFIGNSDGTGPNARFTHPWGLDVDASGNVWIADTDNGLIRRMTPAGVVTTHTTGYFPSGIAIAPDGGVLIADTFNHTIARYAGETRSIVAGTPMDVDLGALPAESFTWPADVAVDPAGNLWIAQVSHVRRITPQGQQSVFAGGGVHFGIARGPDGSMYATDLTNQQVVRISANGARSVLASVPGPRGIAVDSSGFVYVSSEDHRIRTIAPNGGISLLAGGAPGYFDGTGDRARFRDPLHLDVDDRGNVYVADWGNNAIRMITSAGVTSTVATGIFGPNGIVRDANGTLWVSDYNHTIRRIAPDGTVTRVAGLDGSPGNVTGVGDRARFQYPAGLAFDAAGRLVIADEYNHALKIGRPFTGTYRKRAARR